MYTCIHNMDLQPLKKTGYLANMCKAVVTTICQVSSQVMVMTWMVGDTPMTSETSIHVSQQMFEGLQPLRGHAQG